MTTPTQIISGLNQTIYHLAPLTSIVAGGALRDIDHGLYPNDVDVFVLLNSEADEANHQQQISSYLDVFDRAADLEYYDDLTQTGEYGNDDNLNDVHEVHEYKAYMGDGIERLSIQFIFLKPNPQRESVLDSFDLDICKISTYWDNERHKNIIIKSPQYRQAKDLRVVTQVNNRDVLTARQQQKVHERARRISRKLGYAYAFDVQRARQAYVLNNNVVLNAGWNVGINQHVWVNARNGV